MKIIKQLHSKDGKSTKFLQQTNDFHVIETSYIDLDENIICISTQVGCKMGCVFCATTKPVDAINPNLRFIRNLTCDEITQQISNVIGSIQLNSKPILLSYMGMGEPFLNYDNVTCSIKNISSKYPGATRVSIATSGISPLKIKKLAHENFDIEVKVQLSLHAAKEKLRKKIMPGSKSIKKALGAVKYFSKIKSEPMKINYVLIGGINDSDKDAHELVKLLYPDRKDFVLKLMVFNEFDKYKPSSEDRFNKFQAILENSGIKVTTFMSDGPDIKAGCGQLRRHYYANKSYEKVVSKQNQ
ncbi:MAG: radical SAM protein [Candidatus Aenigmarchaeota archaeon]|nr:radical SAM protein [Candidatus Aenigmarchaeota archaeon]